MTATTTGAHGAVGPAPTFAEALRVWARIGVTSFGGPAGQIALMHRTLVEEKGWAMGMAFGDLPAGAGAGVEKTLKSVPETLARNAGGKVISTKEIKLDKKHPGIEMELSITKPIKGHLAMRLYIVGDRVYEVTALGETLRLSDKKVKEFLDSLKVTK